MKGQSIRIYDADNEKRVQGETSCELHISIETESEANKDNADEWDYPAFMGYSFDTTIEVQISSFVKQDEYLIRPTDFTAGATDHLCIALFDKSVYSKTICEGNLICTSASYKADNKKTITATIKHEGSGELFVEPKS